MKILKQISHDREGNDCWIYDSFAVMKSIDTFFFVHHSKVSGYYGSNTMTCTEIKGNVQLSKILSENNFELNEEEIKELCNFDYIESLI